MKPIKRLNLIVSAGLACLLLGLEVSGAPPAPDPLSRFNDAFRSAYAAAKAESLAGAGPVLMVDGDRLALYRRQDLAAQATIRPALYHRLKAVAHMPLALHLLLGRPDRGGPVAANLRDLARAARADLGRWAPPPALARQEEILDGCLRLLDDGLREGLAPGRLAAFTAAMGPLVLANAGEAAALELDLLDRATARFRRDMAPGEWEATRVVVIGSHMAREGEVAMQYFCRLLGEPREGDRIVFAEGLWRPADALDLLATHRVDLAAGAAFFGDPMRMHRDVLADGARQWLDTHLAESPIH